MQDHFAVDAEEHVIVEPRSKPIHVRAARLISNILAPAPISLPLIVLVALYHAQNAPLALLYALITLFFLSIGPFIYILIAVRLGKISDVDVSRRTERAGPFLFGISSVLVSWSRVVLRRHTVLQVVAGSLVSIALTLLILKIRGI